MDDFEAQKQISAAYNEGKRDGEELAKEKIIAILIKYFEDEVWEVYKHDWDDNGNCYIGAYLQDANYVLNLDELAQKLINKIEGRTE
jgi:hypothetical protein